DPCKLTATIMCGLPAAGKDTWVRNNAGELPVMSLDTIRGELEVDPADDQGPVIRAAKEGAKAHLRANRSFIWNATNTTRMLRDGLVDLFSAYGARIKMVYCEAPISEVRRRNTMRPAPVPPHVIEKLMDRLDVPDLTEAHEVLYEAP